MKVGEIEAGESKSGGERWSRGGRFTPYFPEFSPVSRRLR